MFSVSASNLFQRHVTIRGTMETLSLAVRSLDLAIKQDLVPTINALQKNFLDSYDVSHALHSHGINIRYDIFCSAVWTSFRRHSVCMKNSRAVVAGLQKYGTATRSWPLLSIQRRHYP